MTRTAVTAQVGMDQTTDGHRSDAGTASAATPAAAEAASAWVTVTEPSRVAAEASPLTTGQLLTRLAAGVAVVIVLVGVLGSLAARQLSEREAVNDAATTAGLLADSVITPALTSGLQTGDPTALAAFDGVVRDHILGLGVVRVKIWGPDGRVLYADEPQLIGRTFTLSGDQQEAISTPSTRAEISDLADSENSFETGSADRLVEVYRPVWFPDGSIALFEMYGSYAPVGERSSQLWRGFAGVTLSSLILLVVLIAPLLLSLLRRLRDQEASRRALLQKAIDASEEERRRIAATLHDGPVQELAATSFTVAGAAAKAGNDGDDELSRDLSTAAGSVRRSIRALRTLLVDIYPPSLASSGIVSALTDLAHSVRAAGVTVSVDADPEVTLALTEEQMRPMYRVAQECVRNAVAHAGPAAVTVTLRREGNQVALDVIDDGAGFDAARLLSQPAADHFGLRLLRDAAESIGGSLQVSSAPARGTHWRLVVDTS